MTAIEILSKQTKDAFIWTNRLMENVPYEKWDILADGIASNLSWQVGHQVISIYYHTMMTTVGHVPELLETMDLKWYTSLTGYGTSPKAMVGKTDPKALTADLELMQGKSLELIQSLSDATLWEAVRPTKVPHPVAKTKFEAIDWNVKHTLWHCGQIATWKRMVHRSHDFGVAKPE
ncbi:hypothetical protein ABV409_09615 [Flagellimonas sp. DF-77]|uniref:DinB family protein n=1 Tax=Flagellimonas algarum TaxID=3230298 RepID=UPI003393B028